MSDLVELTPIAWVMPSGDRAKDNGFLDAMAWQEGEFSHPLCSLDQAAARIEQLEAEVARLRGALGQAREWFQQYADGHTTKGDTDKAQRNQDRADFCARAAMAGKEPA